MKSANTAQIGACGGGTVAAVASGMNTICLPSDRDRIPWSAPIRNGERGLAILVVLPILFILLAFATAGLRMTDAGLHSSAVQTARVRSFYVADGGVQHALARLHEDRISASRSFTYATSGSGFLDGNPYTYAIVQDPMYPHDSTRKQVTATGAAAGSSSIVISQVQVFGENPLCDWAILADRGTARLVSTIAAGTDLMNGNVHSNNELEVKSTVASGLRGTGRFEAVSGVRSTALASTLSTMAAELYRGGDLRFSGAHLHAPLTGNALFGIHFANGPRGHGVQQAVGRVAFPLADWESLEQDPSVTIVEQDSIPYGAWEDATDTWVVSGLQILPDRVATRYYVRGNVRFEQIVLAQGTDATIAADGAIEIGQLSLLQTNLGGIVGISLNSAQNLRLLGRDDVYVGRGLLQSESSALGDLSRPGLNLSSALPVRNRVAAYSRSGDVWAKSSAITALAATELNLVGSGDATFAVTGSVLSTPRQYCQQL